MRDTHSSSVCVSASFITQKLQLDLREAGEGPRHGEEAAARVLLHRLRVKQGHAFGLKTGSWKCHSVSPSFGII